MIFKRYIDIYLVLFNVAVSIKNSYTFMINIHIKGKFVSIILKIGILNKDKNERNTRTDLKITLKVTLI